MDIETTLRKFIRSKIKAKSDIETKLRIVDNTLEVPGEVVFVDKGRKPGSQPPIKSILDFMRKRGIGNKLSTAYAIAHSIKKKGIKPNPLIDQLAILYFNSVYNSPLPKKEDDQIDKILKQL